MEKKAIYPGTFDPITLGHLDLVERASHIFEQVVLAVVKNTGKETLFKWEQRVQMAEESTEHLPTVEVTAFTGLLVDFARACDARVLLRGIRAYSDFEFEFQMALSNRRLAPDIETLFLMPKEEFSYVSSSIVREVSQLGGDITGFVPKPVQRHLAARID